MCVFIDERAVAQLISRLSELALPTGSTVITNNVVASDLGVVELRCAALGVQRGLERAHAPIADAAVARLVRLIYILR